MPAPVSSQFRGYVVFWRVFGIILFAANAVALALAYDDRSYFAVFTAVIYGPIMNFVLAIGGLFGALFVRRADPARRAGWHILLVLAIPALAIVGDFFIINGMDLHGC